MTNYQFNDAKSGLQAPLSPEKQDFLERFLSFWSAPSGERVREFIASDALVHFSGAGTVSGAKYPEFMRTALGNVQDIKVDVSDYAERGDSLFIFWYASGSVRGKRVRWHGVDLFRIRDGMAIEEYVVFDPQALGGG